MAASACIDTPVAPIGWPLALRPPDGLTGSRPSLRVHPSVMARAPCPSRHSPMASYSISSAMVKQSWVSTNDRSPSATPASAERALPGQRAALELEHVALAHRQEVLHMRGGAENDRLAQPQRGPDIGQHDRGRAVGDRRAIGALERTGDARILLALGAAELVAEILADLRIGIGDAVLVVLGRDQRQRIRLVAVFLEIARGDLAEDAGEAALDLGLLAHVGRLEQVAADVGGRASPSSARRRPPARCARSCAAIARRP